MVNPNGRETDTQSINDKERLNERKSEATSDKTLRDLEENETDSSSTDTGGFDPGPSPDGALDESDEIKDAGPI
jgi:hypothetical protein